MNGDFPIDVDSVLDSLQGADVVSIFFPMLKRSLVVDMRSGGEDGPMVRVLPMVATPEERIRTVRRLRPHFPKPDHLAVIPWPKHVGSLRSLGIWDSLAARLATSGNVRSVRALDRAMGTLRRLEREEVCRALTGDSYNTIWQRVA